jgi:catechol 2,3-dioxygenase-like lactoylglutathione lyase family enzyme
MTMAQLEHANITVGDPQRTAQMLTDLFGWHIRWQGAVQDGAGYSIHVGTQTSYLAIYAPKGASDLKKARRNYDTRGGLNHLGIVVDDLDAVQSRVEKQGYTIHNHADYEPGRRFYFLDEDGIEFEVISYA